MVWALWPGHWTPMFIALGRLSVVVLDMEQLLPWFGVGAFTIEELARRSGSSKTTIYKLWPSAGALALEGYFTTVAPDLAFPDSGNVQADLRSQLHSLFGC